MQVHFLTGHEKCTNDARFTAFVSDAPLPRPQVLKLEPHKTSLPEFLALSCLKGRDSLWDAKPSPECVSRPNWSSVASGWLRHRQRQRRGGTLLFRAAASLMQPTTRARVCVVRTFAYAMSKRV